MMAKVKDSCYQERQEDDQRRRVVGGSTLSYVCPHCLRSPLDIWVREPLVCFQLLANMQAGGDYLVGTIFEGLQEQSRLNKTNEIRRFLKWTTTRRWRLAIWKATRKWSSVQDWLQHGDFAKRLVDEVTLRLGEAGMNRAYSTPPVWRTVDGGATARGRSLARGSSVHQHERRVIGVGELVRNPCGSNKANMVWKLRSQRKRREYYDAAREQKIVNPGRGTRAESRHGAG